MRSPTRRRGPRRRRTIEGASTTSHADIRWLPRVARGRAPMTVLRREDVQSRVASWDRCPYRIASSPILTIVPLIIRRLRGPSPNRITMPSPGVVRVPLIHRPGRLEGCPQEARQLARDRHRDLRRGLVLVREPSDPTTPSLLRLVRNRNHAAWLSFASTREGDPDARPVLIVPALRRYDSEPVIPYCLVRILWSGLLWQRNSL